MEISVIILAAGEGKRMKSQKSKLSFPLCEKPLVKWVVDETKKLTSTAPVVVVGHKAEEVQELLGESVRYAFQNERKGTGHAVMQAVPQLCGKYTIILCGDAPLVRGESLKAALDTHINGGNAATIITAVIENPKGYGRIVKDDTGVLYIVEDKDSSEEELLIKEVNSGMYCFDTDRLIDALPKINNNNAQGEYYFTDVIGILKNEGFKVGSYTLCDTDEILGVNDRVQLEAVSKIMYKRINERHMYNGVSIIDKNTTYISADAVIGCDTVILPNTIVEAKTVIGENCVIGPNSRITNAVILDGAVINSSIVHNSEVGEYSTVGPFAYIRPNCKVGKHCKVGDFVELKNANFDDGSKASHLTYIGDSDVGKCVNFGCGTVTVNYDGSKKFRTVIADNAFIGCNTNLVSPVNVGKDAYIAAGSTITEDVPDNSLAIARSRQINKSEWTDKRNKTDKH